MINTLEGHSKAANDAAEQAKSILLALPTDDERIFALCATVSRLINDLNPYRRTTASERVLHAAFLPIRMKFDACLNRTSCSLTRDKIAHGFNPLSDADKP